MSNNYKFKRDWENAEKAIYDGEGEFDIPVIAPEDYHNVEWIGFNKDRCLEVKSLSSKSCSTGSATKVSGVRKS